MARNKAKQEVAQKVVYFWMNNQLRMAFDKLR